MSDDPRGSSLASFCLLFLLTIPIYWLLTLPCAITRFLVAALSATVDMLCPCSDVFLTLLLQQLMVHSGFQDLYTTKPDASPESPKQTVRRLVEERKGTLEAVTLLGHGLGLVSHGPACCTSEKVTRE